MEPNINIKSKKNIIAIVGIVLSFLLMVIGVTYAYFGFFVEEKNVSSIQFQTGAVDLSLEGSTITFNNLAPIYTEYKDTQASVTTFSINNPSSKMDACYELSMNVTSIDSSLANETMIWEVTNTTTDIVYSGTFDNTSTGGNIVMIDAGQIVSDTTHNFILRIWIAYDNNLEQLDMLGKSLNISLKSDAYNGTCNKVVLLSADGGVLSSSRMRFGTGSSVTITPNGTKSLYGVNITCDEGIDGSVNPTTGVFTLTETTNSGNCNISLEKNYLSSIAEQGDYINYVGNNECPNDNACAGCNAITTTAGSSCAASGYCASSSYAFTAYGWRIAYIDNNGTVSNYADDSVYITTGGSPECLTSTASAPEANIIAFDSAALKYCNSLYAYSGECNSNSAWNMNDTDFQNILGNNGSTLSSCRAAASVACGNANTITANNGMYWFSGAYSDTATYFWQGYSYEYVTSIATAISKGVRPVIRLYTGTTYSSGDGESNSTPFVLVSQ